MVATIPHIFRNRKRSTKADTALPWTAIIGGLTQAMSGFFLAFSNMINHLLSEYTIGQTRAPALEKAVLTSNNLYRRLKTKPLK